MTNKDIYVIYDGVEALMKAEEWEFLNKHIDILVMSVWRTEIDELLSYLTATLPCKSKLPARERYFRMCKQLFPDEKIWDGLE
jgi:hypothetical protein